LITFQNIRLWDGSIYHRVVMDVRVIACCLPLKSWTRRLAACLLLVEGAPF
jgi:hypothetical protein